MRSRLRREQAKKYLSPAQRNAHKKKKVSVLTPPAPYRSWLEADIANALEVAKEEFGYETMKIQYVVPAQVHTYTPDFVLKKGRLVVEAKGRWKADDRKKIGLIMEQNPDLDLRMLFSLDNKISRNSKTRYSDWCKKRGIKYAIGNAVPDAWLEESNDD